MKHTICVVGLGYVGLPLAHAAAKAGFTVIGFDINEKRIEELQSGHDRTDELTKEQLEEVTIEFSANPASMHNADVIIAAIPTPIDDQNKPDLTLLEKASETIGKHVKKGAIVVFESTVYPGTTEEICGPIIEEHSGMRSGTDFFLGYSPERVNPGDKEHTIDKIDKVVAGQNDEVSDTLCAMYGKIVAHAKIHHAPNIKVAEMAKAIENAQRDLNIAFINEIALMCGKIGIHTQDVLAAARTKWNFLRFEPGLVGGHCIGVDPYYLVEKAKMLGMDTHIITAGRKVNNSMGAFVAGQICNAMGHGKKVLVLGLTFKENIPDTRNSKSKDVIKGLIDCGCTVEVHDPFVDAMEIDKQGFTPGSLQNGQYDAVVLLVKHAEYLKDAQKIIDATKEGGLVYDLKNVLDKEKITAANRMYMAL